MKLMHACLGGENRFVASAEISSAVLPASPSFSVLLFEVRMAFESGPAAAARVLGFWWRRMRMCCICWKMLFRKILVSRPTCGLEFLPRFARNEKSTSTLARAQRKSSTMCFASFILACAPRKANSTRSRVTSPHVRQYTEKCRSSVVRSTFSKALNFRNHIACWTPPWRWRNLMVKNRLFDTRLPLLKKISVA